MNERLIKFFNQEFNDYKSVPFWSWNSNLDEAELVKQIVEMKEAGIGGFIMHARTGLKDEYLGEKWFSCISACLEKAKELSMEAWVYDENGWPSGFVGGKLLENEDYRARFLEYSVGEWDDTAYACFIPDEVRGFCRVDKKIEGIEEYHRVYLRISPANTDILNPNAVDAFISETHEEYYRRYADKFGKELVGFFTDEPQYYRWATPYTPYAEPYFDDIRDGLIWLFVQDKRGYEFRIKYYRTLNELYVENFYKKLYDWCEAHGCKLTGHSVDEGSLYAQMWGGAAVMPSYEYEHIPGVDALGRYTVPELPSKQVASVAAQLGKKQILTETYGCCGFDVTPEELKNIAQSQYFCGVNKMCQHLYPYSIASQGKVDHPPVFGPHGNWGKHFKAFNDYFTRLGGLIGETEECVDIAVLHPISDIWLNYVRDKDYDSVSEIEEEFKALRVLLRKHGVTYHFVDERILQRYGKVEGDCLRVGNCSYSTLLVPKMCNVANSTYTLLKEYKGKLCVLDVPSCIDGKPAEVVLPANITIEEILQNAELDYLCEDGNSFITHRKGEAGEFCFIQNLSANENSTVYMKGADKNYRVLHLDTLTDSAAQEEMVLVPDEGVILYKTDAQGDACGKERKEEATSSFRVTDITENYLVLDYAQISKDGKNFGKRYPIYGLFEELLREDYRGEIFVKQTFVAKEKLSLTLLMEKAKFNVITLNGKPLCIEKSDLDVNFVEASLDSASVVGENELIYSFDFWQHDGVHFALFDPLATESLRNCLYYDTSLEPAYIKGNFIVEPDHSLSVRKALPAVSTGLYKEGYPFFMGSLTLTGKVHWNGKEEVSLALDGRFQAAEVYINGREVDLALQKKGAITHCLKEGENEVRIVLRSSLRNLFGPHHFKPEPEPRGVGPIHFTMRGQWKDGYSPLYTDVYNSVPFGVEKITCIYKEK